MRVLQVLEATLGGTRRYLEDVFAACTDEIHTCGLAYSTARADASFFDLLERMRSAGWQTYDLDFRREIDMRRDLRHAYRLRRVLESFQPDVVHAHSSKAGAVARIANFARRRRARLVYSPHAIAANLNATYALLERALSSQLDILSAVSRSEAIQLEALRLVPTRKIRIVSPTIDAAHFAPRSKGEARRELGFGNEPRVVAIGRLSGQKNPLGFIEIVDRLRHTIPNVRAMWIGDGELRDAFTERIRARGLTDTISLAGWAYDVRPFIAASDLFVSCSEYESFGYVTAEAIAMERPAVASAIAGTTDIVTLDTDRCLYPPGDYAAAAIRAAYVLGDRDAAKTIATRARENLLATFSAETTRRQLLAAYA